MELKDIRTLARKILDVNGYEHVPVRFDHSVYAGAWVIFSREDTPKVFSRDDGTGRNKFFYHPQVCEYATLTFSLEFAKYIGMEQVLRWLFHEIAHLKRGPKLECGPKYVVSRFKDEMDDAHDYLWMKEMWKLGYEGKPLFTVEDQQLNNKVLQEAGFRHVCKKQWDPPKSGPWKTGHYVPESTKTPWFTFDKAVNK